MHWLRIQIACMFLNNRHSIDFYLSSAFKYISNKMFLYQSLVQCQYILGIHLGWFIFMWLQDSVCIFYVDLYLDKKKKSNSLSLQHWQFINLCWHFFLWLVYWHILSRLFASVIPVYIKLDRCRWYYNASFFISLIFFLLLLFFFYIFPVHGIPFAICVADSPFLTLHDSVCPWKNTYYIHLVCLIYLMVSWFAVVFF